MHICDALASSGLERLDAEILLSFVLGKDRVWLLAHPEQDLTSDQAQRYRASCKRRSNGEPVAYITGNREFFGHVFLVDHAVLIPRPATEVLVEQTLAILRGADVSPLRIADDGIAVVSCIWGDVSAVRTIVDVGTGSGCIAVTLALACPDITIIASDISEDALRVARRNAEHHCVKDRISFRKNALLDDIHDLHDPFLIVSNPPYIPYGTTLPKDVAFFEPHEALFAGKEGLDILLPLVQSAREHPTCVGFVIECRADQTNKLIASAKNQ